MVRAFRLLPLVVILTFTACGDPATAAAVDAGDTGDVPPCDPAITYEAIASDTSFCNYWIETRQYAGCGVREISRMSSSGVQHLTFLDGKLIHWSGGTDTSRWVACETPIERPTCGRESCSFICYTRVAIHTPTCPRPTDAGADADG